MTRKLSVSALALLFVVPLVGCAGGKNKEQKELEFRKRVEQAEARRFGDLRLIRPESGSMFCYFSSLA